MVADVVDTVRHQDDRCVFVVCQTIVRIEQTLVDCGHAVCRETVDGRIDRIEADCRIGERLIDLRPPFEPVYGRLRA